MAKKFEPTKEKMAKVILVCGKVCCGKTTYTAALQENGAVLLSCDVLMRQLFDEYLGDRHEEVSRKARLYLFGLSLEILRAGTDVVLDWGFWTEESRREAKEFYAARGVNSELHYLCIDDETWQQRIAKRNAARGAHDYLVDDGLREKCLGLFVPPTDADVVIGS